MTWWFSSSAALLVHAGVVLAIPDAPATQPVNIDASTMHLVWLSSRGTLTDAPGDATDDKTDDKTDETAPSRALKASKRVRQAHRVPAQRNTMETSAKGPAPRPQTTSSEPPLLTKESAPAADPMTVGALDTVASSPPGEVEVEAATRGDATERGGAHGAGRGAGSPPGAGRGGASPLAHGPALLASGDPCRGYFPASARVDHAAVRLEVAVDARGRARASSVLNESPGGQHFGSAAQACAAALRFVPAADREGAPIAGVAKLELVFDRS